MTLTSYKEVTIATIPTGYRPVHRVNVPAVLGGIKGEFPTLFVAEGDKLMATLHGGEKSIVASDQLPTMTYWNTWESFPE